MADTRKIVERLLSEDCPVRLLSNVLSGREITPDNVSELERILNVLEMHEEEMRRLRQSIMLGIRDHYLKSYALELRNKTRGNRQGPYDAQASS